MASPAGFIVLSTQRTGSHLLRNVIGSHPAFVHAGEALIPETSKPGSFDLFVASQTQGHVPTQLWQGYLDYLLGQKPSARYVGFLVKYEHVARIMGLDLTSDPFFREVRIIHLVRKNTLRMIASHHLAVARGVHVSTSKIDHEINSAEIPAGDALSQLRKKAMLVETFRQTLRSRPKTCEIAYEEIMNGEVVSEELAARLCEFFDVDDQFTRRPSTVKLGPDRLRDMISNYDAVSAALRGSEFETMLE